LDKEQHRLTYANDNKSESKEASSVFRNPCRPSEFGIWVFGLITPGGSILVFFSVLRWGGLLPIKQQSDREDGNRK